LDESLLDSRLAKAGEYLYVAKEAGRDRIVGREGVPSEVCA
jgi:PleD family two-component response regulator